MLSSAGGHGDDSWEMDDDLLPDSSNNTTAPKATAGPLSATGGTSSADGTHGLPKSRLQNTTTARDSALPTGKNPALSCIC